ncbi:MAG TPA: lipid-A-disaccharide synthase [archaeon]|nr:lipid-A-disaccharide synthase [archaeon]
MKALNIFISAGDPSGEKHAAKLIGELRKLVGELNVRGIGGPAMAGAQAELLCTVDKLAVMGVVEVIEHLGFFYRLLAEIRADFERRRPDLLVLVDFPGFNMRLAKVAGKLGIPVLYYISPQIWAWRKGRKRTIARLADRMAVVFPFEVNLYKGEKLEVEFVGHPLTENLSPQLSREEFCRNYRLDPGKHIVGLMPGSRAQELARHLEIFLNAAARMAQARRDLQFALGLLPHTKGALSEKECRSLAGLEICKIEDDSASLIAHSRLLVAKSGTTTMEAALLGTPMIIAYRTSPLSYFLARLLVRVGHIGMPNLLVQDPAIPELIQDEVTPENLSRLALELVEDSSPLRRRILAQCASVRKALATEKSASRRVAEIVVEMCEQRRGA